MAGDRRGARKWCAAFPWRSAAPCSRCPIPQPGAAPVRAAAAPPSRSRHRADGSLVRPSHRAGRDRSSFGAVSVRATAPSQCFPEQAVLDDAIKGAHAVLPVDLLALLVGPAVVRDADFVDDASHFGHLGGNFGLEAEALLLNGDGLDDAALERLVAGL